MTEGTPGDVSSRQEDPAALNPTPADLRDIGFRVSAWAMIAVLLLLSPANLVILGWFTDAYRDTTASSEVSHRLHEVVFGIFFTLALVGAISQITSTRRNLAGLLQLTIVLLALWLMVAITVRLDYSLLLFLIPLAAMVWFHGPVGNVREKKRLVVWPGALTVVAAPALLTEVAAHVGRAQASAQNHTTHWSVMAAFAVVLLMLAVVVSIGIRGNKVVAWSLAIASIGYGVASLAYPYDASSHRSGYAIALIVWGFAWAVGARGRRTGFESSPKRTIVGFALRLAAVPVVLVLSMVFLILDETANVPHRPNPNQPEITASEVDRATCLSCHAAGVNGAPLLPHEADRVCGDDELCWGGRTDCAGCHSIDPDLGGPNTRLGVGIPLDAIHLAVGAPLGGQALSQEAISSLRSLATGR